MGDTGLLPRETGESEETRNECNRTTGPPQRWQTRGSGPPPIPRKSSPLARA